jgi:hypothetical protein
MSEDDDFARLRELESIAKTRNDEKARRVLDILLTDLSFDADGPLDEACSAIDKWGVRMDAVIAENLDHESINSFVALVSKHKREIEMARLVRERHAKSQPAIQWVRNEWATKSSEYRSKREFGQTYVQLVLEDFPEIKKITWRTIAEDWLKDLLPK